MCADVDYYPRSTMKDQILSSTYDRRSSWTTSISSSSSSTTTAASWLERKLFSHFKRFFRRKSLSLTSNSSLSSRRPSSITDDSLSPAITEQAPQVEVKVQKEKEEEEENKIVSNENPSSSLTSSSAAPEPPPASPVDLLYDYDRLLARCLKRQEQDRPELILRCQTPVSIPHAELAVGPSRTIVVNWKSYVRLFRALSRDPHVFQQYITEYYACQSSINQREQLTLNVRTSKATFDNVLRKFLDDYVTCLICQTAQTHLIKSDGIWQIECQLCGSQRTVKRLKCKHHH